MIKTSPFEKFFLKKEKWNEKDPGPEDLLNLESKVYFKGYYYP